MLSERHAQRDYRHCVEFENFSHESEFILNSRLIGQCAVRNQYEIDCAEPFRGESGDFAVQR